MCCFIKSVLSVTPQAGKKIKDGELRALKKQMKRLQIQLNKKMTKADSSASPATVSAVSSKIANSPTRTSTLTEEHFCYPNQENQSKVIKRLIQALKLPRVNQSCINSSEIETNCKVKRSLNTRKGRVTG